MFYTSASEISVRIAIIYWDWTLYADRIAVNWWVWTSYDPYEYSWASLEPHTQPGIPTGETQDDTAAENGSAAVATLLAREFNGATAGKYARVDGSAWPTVSFISVELKGKYW